MIGCYGPWKTKWDQSGIKSKIKNDETVFSNSWQSWIKDILIDPSCPGQNQPDRREERIVAGLIQGQRSLRVTLFMLRHQQHPLDLFVQEAPQRVGGYLPSLIESLELTKVINRWTCQSVCVSAAFLCVWIHGWNVQPPTICILLCVAACFFYLLVNLFFKKLILMNS